MINSWTRTMPSDEDLREAVAKEASLPLSDQLQRQADAETERGDQYKGCSWVGFEHPSAGHYRAASLLRQAAVVALQDEQRRAKRRKTKP